MLGKHSGRAALADRAKALGYHARPASSWTRVFEQFKVLADKKKEIYDADLAALIEQQMQTAAELWSLESYEVSAAPATRPAVSLRLRRGERDLQTTSGLRRRPGRRHLSGHRSS